MKRWYYVDGGQKQGPVTIENLKGKVTKETLVWREEMNDWKKAGEIIELASIFAITPPPIPEAEEVNSENNKHLSRIKDSVFYSWLFLFATICMGIIEYTGAETNRIYRIVAIACLLAFIRVMIGLKSYLSHKLNYTKANININWIIGLSVPFTLFMLIDNGKNMAGMSDSTIITYGVIAVFSIILYIYHSIMLVVRLFRINDHALISIKTFALLNIIVIALQIVIIMLLPEHNMEAKYESREIILLLFEIIPIAFLIHGMKEIKQKCVEQHP